MKKGKVLCFIVLCVVLGYSTILTLIIASGPARYFLFTRPHHCPESQQETLIPSFTLQEDVPITFSTVFPRHKISHFVLVFPFEMDNPPDSFRRLTEEWTATLHVLNDDNQKILTSHIATKELVEANWYTPYMSVILSDGPLNIQFWTERTYHFQLEFHHVSTPIENVRLMLDYIDY